MKFIDQLTKELKNHISMNDELSNEVKEKDSLISKLNKQLDIQKQQLNDYQSELKYAQKEKANKDKDASLQFYQQDQRFNQNLQDIQQAHSEQMQIMDDQVQKLQEELIRRNQAIEFQKQEIMQLDKIINEMKVGEKTLIQSSESYKIKYQELLDEKKKDITKFNNLNQKLNNKKKNFLMKRNVLCIKLAKCNMKQHYQINKVKKHKVQKYNKNFKDLISGLQDEIQSQVDQNCYLQEQHQKSSYDLELKYKKTNQEHKIEYEQQKNKLCYEISKLSSQLKITLQQLCENQELNQELQISLDTLNKHNETTSQQLSKLQIEFEQLQLQYENDITDQNQEIVQLNDQIAQLTELFEHRSNELDDARQLRGELALKNNENNLLIQRLQNELESQKQKLFELQKQHQIQGQVKDEISKSQFEQMKNQMESEIELLENYNKTIRYQLQMKSKELKSGSSSIINLCDIILNYLQDILLLPQILIDILHFNKLYKYQFFYCYFWIKVEKQI